MQHVQPQRSSTQLRFVMYDHQSQAPSTHHAPFDAWLKEALRLNRDPVLLLPDDRYQDLAGGLLVTAAWKRAVVGAFYVSTV